MATCARCRQNMVQSVTCTSYTIVIAGQRYEPIRYGQEERYRSYGPWPPHDECHDCGAPVAAVHHIGCDVEECPRCRGQLISCDC